MTEPDLETHLEVSRIGPTAVVKFNNPEQRNPLSREVMVEIASNMSAFAEDRTCRGVVFTGTGQAFAAGADLRQIAGFTADEALEFGRFGQSVLRLIREFRGISVAAVNGFCIGGALDLALSCSCRIASPGAKFAHPGVSLGIITGWGGTQLLPRLIGSKNAYRLLLTAEPVGADEALSMGLIDEIAEEPLERSLEYVEN